MIFMHKTAIECPSRIGKVCVKNMIISSIQNTVLWKTVRLYQYNNRPYVTRIDYPFLR